MKKILSLLLIFSLAMSLPDAAFAAGASDAPVSVTIIGPSSYTAAATSTKTETIKAFEAMIKNSKKSKASEADLKEILKIGFDYNEGDNQAGRTDITSAYKSTGGKLYIKQDNKFREIDAKSFYNCVDAMGKSFYTLRDIPEAKAGGIKLAVTKSDYSFEKLDGKFYKTQYTAGKAPKIRDGGKFPQPVFSMRTNSVKATVKLSGSAETVFQGSLKELEKFTPKKDGTYNVAFDVSYKQPHAAGTVRYEYSFTHDTAIRFTLDGASTNPGEVVVVRGKNIPKNAEITYKTDLEFSPEFFRDKSSGDMIALLPVSYYTKPGNHYIQLTCNGITKKYSITAGDKKFTRQDLTVAAETAEQTIYNQQADAEFEENIAPIRYSTDPQKYWKGRFIWPLKASYRITTPFGAVRYTNNDPTPSRHGAIDMAAPAGTPVYASGAGRVLYSGYLKLTGNTIVIEHGYGLKTWHYHMNGRNVETGDIVKQGQQIGVVGSTGFSTGAHLHFGMSVSNKSGNVFVNPETAITTDLFNY